MAEPEGTQAIDLFRQRHATLKTERSTWDGQYQEIATYLKPRAGRFNIGEQNDGKRKPGKIIDSAGSRALRTLGAGLMGGATSPARPWFRLSTPDPEMADFGAVKAWLHEVQRLMMMVFQRSNSYRALHTMYEEIGAFGTGCSVVVEDFQDVIRHHSLTIGEYTLAQDDRGVINTMYRDMERTVSQVVQQFGMANVSPTVKNMYDRGLLGAKVHLIHLIEPRMDRDHRLKDNRNMPFRSAYFEAGSDNQRFLLDSGFKTFPALTPRWTTTSGDTYGESPAMEALGDLKQLYHQQLRKGQGIDYKTNPPLQVPLEMQNQKLAMLPGGVSYVNMNSQHGRIQTAFDVNIDLSHLLEDIHDVRGRIESAFYSDLFMMIANSTRTNMTATEVAERHEEKLLMLGPVLERLHNELLDPMIDMTFNRLAEVGALPPPPPELQGVELRVEYVSMLAQAQRAVSTNSIDRFVGNLGQVAMIKPEVLDKFDSDRWADEYADMLGIDPNLIIPGEKVAVIRQQRAEAMAQAEQAQQEQLQAATMKDVAQAEAVAPQNAMAMFSGY